MKNFSIINKFGGYRRKTDKTNIGPGYLVEGSQNVVSTDGERIAIRQGYTLDGAANSANNNIESSYEWNTHRGVQIPLRSYDDELEIRYNGAWYKLADGWSAVDFNFAEFWDTTESQDLLLFVNGDSNIYDWSGGIATFASATANTITKQGSDTWGFDGFLTAGTRTVVIEGTTYTYTGGEGTTTLTGVTPDPSVAGHTVGAVVVQGVRTNSNKPGSGLQNDIISVLNNQCYVAGNTNRQVFISQVDDFLTYTFSSPRLVGEGALLTLDSTPVGFIPLEDYMTISGSKSDWYRTKLTLSSDLQNEALQIERLKTAPQDGAISQAAIGRIKNDVVFINHEPSFDVLGRLQDIDTPTSKPLSDTIKTDFDNYDFTGAHVKYFKNNIYLALPAESKVLVYNLEKGFWESPWTLPAGRLAIIDDDLYLHSNSVPETYKLFEGYNDNGAAINAIATFSYMSFDRRDWQKAFDEWLTEGYIQSNTVITLKVNYDYDGYNGIREFLINGDDDSIIFRSTDDGSLGKHSLGKRALGGRGETISDVLPPKFRIIHTTVRNDFYEVQCEYSTNDVDQRWELLSFGPNVTLSKSDNIPIKK